LTAFAIQAVEQTAFSGTGIIESTVGGFKFPDGSVQVSAIPPPCTDITYVPYEIILEGVYCFSGHLETSVTTGNAITINVDNVVINMNGWKLDGLGAGTATQTNGIYAGQHNNITIRNGTIRGFYRGIYLSSHNSQGYLVENIRAEKNTFIGLVVFGTGNIVRQNQVVDTTGSIVNTDAYGMVVGGIGGQVLENEIVATVATGSYAAGLTLDFSNGTLVEGNHIVELDTNSGTSNGMDIRDSVDVLIVGNRISRTDYGVFFTSSTGKYRDNLTSNIATTEFIGGTDAGGND